MASGSIGMSGTNFDAFVSSQRTHNEPDWATKIQEKYWLARQKFLAKVERNEDSCIVLSDTKLDAKLEVYRSIDSSCARLTNILESYQNCLFMFANEENALGILLKECGKHDKTKAGKIMSITGKSLTQSSHQRIRLYMPLLRLFQEMETFHTRAVEDTAETVDRLESRRSQYRASLLWMKDISEKLNPDVYKQLERFRRIQAKVRDGKRAFDSMQMDVVQKIDLLMASRCNLMNQILAPYQTILLETFEKNYNNFKSVEAIIKNEDIYEYEFKALKQLNPLSVSDENVANPHKGGENELEGGKKEVAEDNLIGNLGEGPSCSEENSNNEGHVTSGDAYNLIDTSSGNQEYSPCQLIDESKGNLDLLESLFGQCKTGGDSSDKISESSCDVNREGGDLRQSTDLKFFMSKLDVNLIKNEDDEEKQIASLLEPSENLRRRNVQRSEESTSIQSVDDDIFARWARDADIDLLGDGRYQSTISKNEAGNSQGPRGQQPNNGVHDKTDDLMDLEPTRDRSIKDFSSKTRFYA